MSSVYHIIIADDHQIVIDGIKSVLSNTEYQVSEEALNGQAAYNIISSNPDKFHLLITDISMPLLSGTELCKMVKHSFPHIKVLILSMYSSSSVVKEVVMAEADGFILKNAGKEELQKAIHKILNDGTYYSDEIIPIIYHQIEKEKKQKENTQVLSEREREILSLIVKEFTSEQIAEKLFISKKTVDNHRTNILDKTGCKSTIGLVKYALKNGIE
jgi:two-component system, NarL family, nitrate/nitrite response regulator NarL